MAEGDGFYVYLMTASRPQVVGSETAVEAESLQKGKLLPDPPWFRYAVQFVKGDESEITVVMQGSDRITLNVVVRVRETKPELSEITAVIVTG